RLIVLKGAGATTMALASATLSGSSGSRHRVRTGKPGMASGSGAWMNASASGVAVTAPSQPAACASFTRSWTWAAGGAAQTTTYSVPRGACSPIRVTSLTVSDEAVIPVWRTRRCRLLRGLRRGVAEGGEQLGGGAVLGGLEVGVGPQRDVRAGVAGPTGRGAPVHALGDQAGGHQVPKVVQAAY